MTGYTVNTGATTKFSEGWDRIFGTGATKASKRAAKAAEATPVAKKATAKKTATPTVAKTVKSKQAAQKTLASGKR